jgi:hypothetical protein
MSDDVDIWDVNRQIEKLSIDVTIDKEGSNRFTKGQDYLTITLMFGSKVLCECKVSLPECEHKCKCEKDEYY